MTTNRPRKRLYSHVTKTRFLHLEDALNIGDNASRAKIRLFAGEYRKGGGATATAFHFLDLDDARVILSDLSWGKKVTFTDYKGSTNGDGPQSRVLKIKANGDKTWLEIQNGPGETIGQGAVKPKGKPASAVSIPLTTWEARKLAHAALAYIRAWETHRLLDAAPTAPGGDPSHQVQPTAPPPPSPSVATQPVRLAATPVTTSAPIPSNGGQPHQAQPAATPPPSPPAAIDETVTSYWTFFNKTAKPAGVAYTHALNIANKHGENWSTAIASLQEAMAEAIQAKAQATA